MIFFAILAVAVLFPACSSSLIAEEIVVVAFGDSTTAPRGNLPVYADLLREDFRERQIGAKVVNAGVGGNTTRAAASRFDADVVSRKPDIVIIQFGINDAAIDLWKTPPATKPRVGLKEYETNLRTFIKELKRRNVQPVLMTPNPLRWTPKLKKLYGKAPYRPGEENGFNVLLVRYAKAVRRIGKEESVPVVDVYSAFQNYGKKNGQRVDDLLLDGIHPNEKGQQLVFKLLKVSLP